jgi:hypothetical protein
LALNQHVEDLALVIDGTPQIHLLAGDPHHHLVEVPAIARSSLGALLARSGDAALNRHEKEQNLTPPSSFSRNDSPTVFVCATPNLLEVSR